MKTQADLVKGWLRKAESDLTASSLCLAQGQALDTACFHAQQAAEKCLKAYLVAQNIAFPFTHNLEKLTELCMLNDASFSSVKSLAQNLTPFAVELRYDAEFWPSPEIAQQALDDALAIKQFVLDRTPPSMRS
jgi:HEPN domain-containing protein